MPQALFYSEMYVGVCSGGPRVGEGQVSAGGVLVDVVPVGFEVFAVTNAVVGVAALPDGELGGEAVGEAAFDSAEAHGAFEGDGLRSEEEMNVVGHDDEGVEEVVALGAVVLEGFEEELAIGGELKEAAGVVGTGGYEVSAGAGGAARDRHEWDFR